MDTRNLKFFVTTAECGSINRAAKELFISQPHLSHIIQELEEEAGFQLIRRMKKGVALTPKGQLYLEHCRNILREMDGMSRLGEAGEGRVLRFHAAITRFTEAAECFTSACRTFQERERFSFRLMEDSTFGVIDLVDRGTAELGVIHFSSSASDQMMKQLEKQHLSYLHLAKLRPYLAVSDHHPLIRAGRPITLQTLLPYGFIRYTGQYEDFFYRISTADRKLDLNESPRVISVNDREAQLRLLAKTDCFTIGIMDFEEQQEDYHVVCTPIENSSERIHFGVIWSGGTGGVSSRFSGIEQAFIDALTTRFSLLEEQDQGKKQEGTEQIQGT